MEKRRVLVVEDEPHLLAGICDILEFQHYKVLQARHGEDALAVIRSDPDNPPDVIVSDIMMPHMDGFQFLEEVRKERHWMTVQFIFLTAKVLPDDKRRAALLGADNFLTKPFEAEDLLVSVKAAIDRKDSIDAAHKDEIENEKRNLLEIVNHEIRTPLSVLVGFSGILSEYDPDTMAEGDVMTFVRELNSGATRLRRLLENFIILVELDSGQVAKDIAWRSRPLDDLSTLVNDAVRQVSAAEQHSRQIVTEVQPGLPPVSVDIQYMTKAIQELLDNAVKFSNAETPVMLRVQHVDNHVEIQVQDEGRGIAENEHEAIWQRFYQINRRELEDQGAGSGLAIVDGLVRLHGGSRRLESTVGGGSTFCIRLPVK